MASIISMAGWEDYDWMIIEHIADLENNYMRLK